MNARAPWTLRFEELNEWRIHGIQFHSYKKTKKVSQRPRSNWHFEERDKTKKETVKNKKGYLERGWTSAVRSLNMITVDKIILISSQVVCYGDSHHVCNLCYFQNAHNHVETRSCYHPLERCCNNWKTGSVE